MKIRTPLWPGLALALPLLAVGATAPAHEKHRETPAAKAPQPTATLPSDAEVVAPLRPERADPIPATSSPGGEPRSDDLVSWTGRLHPTIVHFPIALLIAALTAELLYAATGAQLFRHACRFTLWGGALGALAAAPLGWAFAATGVTEKGWLLEAHRWTGAAAGLGGVFAVWLAERAEEPGSSRALLRISLGLEAALVATAGFLGGSLLYGIDHLLWRA